MKRLGYSRGAPLEIDVSVRTVHSQISFIVKSFFFTFIGLMLEPPWSLLALGVLLGFALLAARGPVVRLVTRGGEFDAAQRKLITIALPRGMAAGVLATMPAYHGIAGTEHLPSMVFAAVITSIAIYAVGLPMVRRTRANSPSGGNRRRVPPEVATPLASEAPAVRTAASESVPAPQWDANPPTPEQASGSALPLL
jgi:NhaP-type Na+/H+ or K+/H+ antiporter